MPISRRIFLKDSALAMVGVGTAPLWLERAAMGMTYPRKKVLVAIFQRGAADGLNIVVPHGEQNYYNLRPTIAIEQTQVIDLDGLFGLNPALASLKPLWDKKELAIVHAAGSPDPTRSHFDAQDYMESGTPGLKSTDDGWLNRALLPPTGPISPVRAVSLGPTLPRAMRGRNEAVAVESLGAFTVRDAAAAKSLEAMYMGTGDQVLNGTGKATFEAVSLLQSLQKTPYTPADGAKYPAGRFGDSLRQVAQMIKADVGVEVAFADIGGWDHHVQEFQHMPPLLTEFGNALAAFYQDLGDRMEDVVLVTMSEFGRAAKENGDRGTDHGHANVMFVMGGPVQGGKVYGKWPGLAHEQLYEARDLALTTDFRDVLSEAVYSHLGNKQLTKVFPNYQATPERFKNYLKA